MNKKRKAQSAIEYFCVAVVFCTVGVLAFLGTQKGMATSRRGTPANYQDKIVGRMLENQTISLEGAWNGQENVTNTGGDPTWNTTDVIETEEEDPGFSDVLGSANETGGTDTNG